MKAISNGGKVYARYEILDKRAVVLSRAHTYYMHIYIYIVIQS